ncbi:MAG: hypothetical protein AAFV88_06470 [Planctomycetota bacterium]
MKDRKPNVYHLLSDRHARNRRGQTVVEYAILTAAMMLGTIVGVVVLNTKLAELVAYSIDVTTYDEATQTSLNPSVPVDTLLPMTENADGDLILDGPTSLDEATGIDDIGDLIETLSP